MARVSRQQVPVVRPSAREIQKLSQRRHLTYGSMKACRRVFSEDTKRGWKQSLLYHKL